MRVFFSVGDASGDLYVAFVAEHLKGMCPDWVLEGIGGTRMLHEGIRLYGITTPYSAVGAWASVQAGFRLWTLFRRTKRSLLSDPPDLFVPVDFGTFNRPLLAPLARRGVKVCYFIPPRLWGLPPKKLRQLAHPNIVFVPIYDWQREKLSEAGLPIREFGHPLVDALLPYRYLDPKEARRLLNLPLEKRLIALMPGSRRTTVKENLPILLSVAESLKRRDPNLHFAIGFPPDWHPKGVSIPKGEGWSVHQGQTPLLLRACDAACLVAGTVTLEAACLGTPSVVIFWTGLLNRLQVHWMRWRGIDVLKLGPFALPNRILGEKVMPEFVGWGVNPERIAETLWESLMDERKRETMKKKSERVWQRLGAPGASERIAAFLAEWVRD